MTRRILLCLAMIGGLSALAPMAEAQIVGGGVDPFSQYFGFYLPRQAALAAQPTTPQMINQVAVARQEIVQQDRSGLYNPGASPFFPNGYDPLNPFSGNRGAEHLPRLSSNLIGGRSSSTPSPAAFYNRTGTYYPTYRASSGPNANQVKSRFGGGSAGRGISGVSGLGGGFGVN